MAVPQVIREAIAEKMPVPEQDWGTSWTRLPLSGDEVTDVLAFARCFYFGE